MANKEDSANAVIIGFLSTRTSGDIAFFGFSRLHVNLLNLKAAEK